MADDHDARQAAYSAVLVEIHGSGYPAHINAYAWRCVHSALDAYAAIRNGDDRAHDD